MLKLNVIILLCIIVCVILSVRDVSKKKQKKGFWVNRNEKQGYLVPNGDGTAG